MITPGTRLRNCAVCQRTCIIYANERKEDLMNRFCKAAKTVLLLLTIATVLLSPRANAQTQTPTPKDSPQVTDPASADGWHVGITPYIWFAGLHGTSGVLGHDASVHASFGDIFNYLNIGAMGVVETRYNRVVMPVDFIWMKLSDDKGLPENEVGVTSIKAKMTESVLTPKIGYRIVDTKKIKVDALFGIRYWHVSTDFTLQPVQIQNGLSDSANWVDAVAGGRIEIPLSAKASITVAGDAGGGSARSDYQVGGSLGYKITRKCTLVAGYRYMSVNYRSTGNAQFVYDVTMPGLAIGATFNLK